MAGWLEALGSFAGSGMQALDRYQMMREMDDRKQWERAMKERSMAIGGRLEIAGWPGKGTTVTLRFPCGGA